MCVLLLFTEMKPWDHIHGYHSILGNMRVAGVTLADFEGAAACSSSPASGAFALSNHPHAPDAFHPHFFSNVRLDVMLLHPHMCSSAICYDNSFPSCHTCQW